MCLEPLTFQKKLQKIDSQRKFEEKELKSKNEDVRKYFLLWDCADII